MRRFGEVSGHDLRRVNPNNLPPRREAVSPGGEGGNNWGKKKTGRTSGTAKSKVAGHLGRAKVLQTTRPEEY